MFATIYGVSACLAIYICICSAYPALVLTLSELFDGGTVEEFLMSWNRRIPESALFFENMKEAGALCYTLNNE